MVRSGRRYYERVEDLRCHLEETPWDWSSGGPSASSCGAPHPKLGIYSGGMSGSGDWQVSGPLKGHPLHWKLGQLQFLHDIDWKYSAVGPVFEGLFTNYQAVKSICLMAFMLLSVHVGEIRLNDPNCDVVHFFILNFARVELLHHNRRQKLIITLLTTSVSTR